MTCDRCGIDTDCSGVLRYEFDGIKAYWYCKLYFAILRLKGEINDSRRNN